MHDQISVFFQSHDEYEPLHILNCKVEPLHEQLGTVQEHLNSSIFSVARLNLSI